MDKETGMYYYGARYYDPRISIFVSVDPLAEKYPNYTPYHYVHQNPVNMIDPTGMEGESIGVREVGGGKYEVVSGKADGDKGIYIVDSNGDYNKNSERIAETKYPHIGWKYNKCINAVKCETTVVASTSLGYRL